MGNPTVVNGPRTDVTDTVTTAYDRERRAIQVTAGTAATVNKAYDGQDLVAKYDAAGMLQGRWVHGPGVDEPLVAYEGTSTANKSWRRNWGQILINL